MKISEGKTTQTEQALKIARADIRITDHHGTIASIALTGDRAIDATVHVAERDTIWHYDNGTTSTSTDRWFVGADKQAAADAARKALLAKIAKREYTAKVYVEGYSLDRVETALRKAHADVSVEDYIQGEPYFRLKLLASYQTNAVHLDGQSATYDDLLEVTLYIAPMNSKIPSYD